MDAISMTGAGRLSSGPQPVTANAAPLFLSCIVYRRHRRYSAPVASSVRDGSPQGENPAQAGVSAPADSPVPQGDGRPPGCQSAKSVDEPIAPF